jgi:hypothetical protein
MLECRERRPTRQRRTEKRYVDSREGLDASMVAKASSGAIDPAVDDCDGRSAALGDLG